MSRRPVPEQLPRNPVTLEMRALDGRMLVRLEIADGAPTDVVHATLEMWRDRVAHVGRIGPLSYLGGSYPDELDDLCGRSLAMPARATR